MDHRNSPFLGFLTGFPPGAVDGLGETLDETGPGGAAPFLPVTGALLSQDPGWR